MNEIIPGGILTGKAWSMGYIKALPLIVAGYVMSSARAWAQDLCPTGPFETDVRAIAATIASQPLRPRVWDASRRSERPEHGADWESAGGLLSTVGLELTYDAARYVAVRLSRNSPLPHTHTKSSPPAKLPNQVIRLNGHTTNTTTITRPTPEEARRFACLANRLAAPSLRAGSARPPRTAASVEPPPKSSNSEHPTENCSSEAASSIHGTDSYDASFSLLSNGSVMKYDMELPCATRAVLLFQMEQLVNDMIEESIARGRGTWQAPHVSNIATDAAGNLYLLRNPGSLRHFTIDLLKVTSSGDMTRLPSPPLGMEPYPETFAVDDWRHAWVPVSGATAARVYDIASDGEPSDVDHVRPDDVFHPTRIHQHVDSVAVDPISHHLYATSGTDILEITPSSDTLPGGAVVPVAKLTRWTKTRWFSHPLFHIAAASDHTLYVSAPSDNIILKISPGKVVTILAGTPGRAGATDGPGGSARFNSPKGLALDRDGTLYVADSSNHTIRRITADGRVSTLVGKPGKRGAVDGQGEMARLDRPASIAVDSTGTLYVSNGEDNLIRKISPAGVVSTLNAQRLIDAQ